MKLKMKLYKLIITAFVAFVVTSCSTDYDVNEYFDLEELPAYVAFDADGNDITVPARSISEDGGSTSVIVEHPTEIFSDVTVNYSLGGTAVFGVDYTIEGATAAGGSMTISSERGDESLTYQGSFTVTALDNIIVDEDKTVILTLTSASNSEGDIAIGRGGKEFQREAIVNIINDECASEYGGMYTVSTTYMQIDTNIVDTVFTEDGYTTMITKTGDFSYDIEEASGGLYTAAGLYGMNFGTTGMPLSIVEDCGGVSFGGQMDELGQEISMGSGGNSVDDMGVFTISIETLEATSDTTSVVREIFTSTYTPM